MNAAFRTSDVRARPRWGDIAALPIRDRAALRLLYRMEAATVRQLTDLAYRRLRQGQYRLQQLWHLRLIERRTRTLSYTTPLGDLIRHCTRGVEWSRLPAGVDSIVLAPSYVMRPTERENPRRRIGC